MSRHETGEITMFTAHADDVASISETVLSRRADYIAMVTDEFVDGFLTLLELGEAVREIKSGLWDRK
jgi:hypothetical protein